MACSFVRLVISAPEGSFHDAGLWKRKHEQRRSSADGNRISVGPLSVPIVGSQPPSDHASARPHWFRSLHRRSHRLDPWCLMSR